MMLFAIFRVQTEITITSFLGWTIAFLYNLLRNRLHGMTCRFIAVWRITERLFSYLCTENNN